MSQSHTDRSQVLPLDGVTVIDLSRALAGPHAGMMLGDLGARVIKVESPGKGDDTRGWGPPFVGPEEDPISTYFLSCNRNKESITLDLKSEAGKKTLSQLIERADVLIENFRPGVMERLGFGEAECFALNPRIVQLKISGFGHDGPEGGRPGYDQIAQGEAGLMSMTGAAADEPTRVGVPIGDLLAGMYGAYGVVSALYEREHTGKGAVVRTSLLSAIVGVHAFQGTRYTVAGEIPQANGNHHPSICPYGLFHCADGMLQIAVGSESLWQKFAPAYGIDPDAAGQATNAERVANRDQVIATVNEAFSQMKMADLLPQLDELGIPAGQVRDLEQVYTWDQTKSQGLLVEVDHPVLGKVELPGPPLRFFDEQGERHRAEHIAPPLLGANQDSVAAWLESDEK